MDRMQQLVEKFHSRFGQPVATDNLPGIRRAALRCALISEEADETCNAIEAGSLVDAIDGLCDLIYVCLGTASEFGIDLEPFFDEIHRSNLEKVGGSTRPDGKILKPPGWVPPDIRGLLNGMVR